MAASSNSGGAISYSTDDPGIATIDPATGALTLLSVGSTLVTASQAAAGVYGVGSTAALLTVEPIAPTISMPNRTVSASNLQPMLATSNSAGAISYSIDDPAIATIDPATGALTLLSLGTTTVTATQGAAGIHAAGSTTATLIVEAAVPTITLPAVSAAIGAGGQSATATSNSSGAITYSIDNPGVATINPTTGALTLLAPGQATITATQAAAGLYGPATTTAVLQVTAAAEPVPVPTLGQWGMLLLSSLLALGTFIGLRRRHG